MFGREPGSDLVAPDDAIRRAFDYVRKNRGLHRLFLMRDPQLAESLHHEARDEIVTALELVFRNGAEQGVLRPMNARIAAELMYALVAGALEACFDIDAGAREEEYLRETVQCVAGALIPLAAPHRAPPSGGAAEE
jgi:hypothetical protein